MRGLHYTCLVLVIIGALNWGLIGFFGFDLVAAIFGGQDAAFSRIVYALVGLAGLTLIFTSAEYYRGEPVTARRQRHVPT
jgi:uncharacterized protein